MHLTNRLLIRQCGREEWVLLNTLTGAVDVVDREGFEQLNRMKESDFSTTDPGFVAVLRKRGYVFEDNEEDELLRRMFEEHTKKVHGGPVKALICPTFACNLGCTYCFQGDLREKVSANLRKEEIGLLFRSLDKIVREKKACEAQINLSGGEPLLRSNYELTDRILQFASERNYPVGITTNGVNVVHFRPLLEKYQTSIGNVQVTIDGPARVHNQRRRFLNGSGSFDRIVKGVDLLMALEIPTVLRVNVDLQNVDFLPELAEFISSKRWNGKKHFRARLAKVENHTEIEKKDSDSLDYTLTELIESLTSRYSLMRDAFVDTRISRTLGQISKIVQKEYGQYNPNFYYCEATSAELYVFGADGLLYPCGEAAGNPSFSVGRFLPRLEIDQDKVKCWQNQSIVEIPECSQCSIALLCGGGCRYQTLKISNESRKQLCDDRKKQIERFIELHAKSYH